MKRLTDEGGICIDCDGIAYCKTDCFNKQIYDKLKCYEDLEEQGKLIHIHHGNVATNTKEEAMKQLGL